MDLAVLTFGLREQSMSTKKSIYQMLMKSIFHGKLYNLKGKQARELVLNYYNENHSMLEEGTGRCYE